MMPMYAGKCVLEGSFIKDSGGGGKADNDLESRVAVSYAFK